MQNNSESTARVAMFSSMAAVSAVVYPDSDMVQIFTTEGDDDLGCRTEQWRGTNCAGDPTFGIGLLLAWTISIGAGSALLHEYGHAWTARAVGWNVVDLRWRWYGVALVADPNGKPDQLWKVALGGLSMTALLTLGFLAATALPRTRKPQFRARLCLQCLVAAYESRAGPPFRRGVRARRVEGSPI